MARVTVTHREPVRPPIDRVTIELSGDEATNLRAFLWFARVHSNTRGGLGLSVDPLRDELDRAGIRGEDAAAHWRRA